MTVRPAAPTEFDVVLPVCVEAFADEAMSAWVEPAPERRLERTRELFATSLRSAVDSGHLLVAWTDAGEPVAASIWMVLDGAPTAEELDATEGFGAAEGSRPVEGLGAAVGSGAANGAGAADVHDAPEADAGRTPAVDGASTSGTDSVLAAPATRRLAAVLTATSARHPDVPHVYLSAMATLPRRRGLGAGSAMLRQGIAMARGRGLPVYLEASTRRNQRLYARHGFRAHGAPLPLPDDGPTLQPMWLERVIHRS
ncbi:GNAT family N-acetyltransferase [Promicromonospora sukumoe]|uniref:GNAT family N-acetyltransferase n=1 Tax=Promicromonospora sukumoe TaxID=88382 RepID=UPI0003726D2A|nr:GNAT family N-acetyltransferase [Promicromonospora sukumoe]